MDVAAAVAVVGFEREQGNKLGVYRLVDHLAATADAVAVDGGVGVGPSPIRHPTTMTTSRSRVSPRVVAASVDGDDCWCCRKTFGPGCYPGDTPARSKEQSCRCKPVVLAAVGNAEAKIAAGVCSGLSGRSVGPGSHCFAFGDLDLSSGSWTYS